MYKKIITTLFLSLGLFANEASVEQLFNVVTVKVKSVNEAKKTKNYGYVKIDESKQYDVSPRFGGYVEKLYANKLYKKVKKGEKLAEVYSPEVLKAKDEYLNTIRYTKKRPNKSMLKSAKLKLKLLGISDTEISKIKSKNYSPNTIIYAPIDGYVFMKSISEGSAFNAKQKLFSIVNIDDVWVEVKLFEEQRKALASIEKYEIKFKGIDKVYSTTNALLYPMLDPKIATMTLRLHVDNTSNKLFPGMYASVTSLESSAKRLILPTTAVILKDSKYYAFVVGEYEGEYEPLEVQIKVVDANTYEILSGLSEGDEVVNNALFMMDSDAQINGLY